MDLLKLVTSQLGGDAVGQLSKQLGAPQQQTSAGLQAAVPLLLGAMGRNAQTDAGAQALNGALDRDHDGSVLDNLGGFLGGGAAGGAGAGILKHVLGGQQQQAAEQVASASGLSQGNSMQLLQMAAPLVMGVLGKQKQGGLDVTGLLGMLGGGKEGGAGQLLGLANQFLDKDGDGSALDDVGGMLGGLFGRK